MEKLPENPECALSGTKYCRLLNMHACEQCTIRGSENLADVQKDIDLYETLLPEGGVARLFHSKECQFCKTEPKGERAGYAILDMAHPEPKRVQKWLLGKRTTRFGTMIPVQMSVCKKCRTRFRLIDAMPVAVSVVLGAIGLALFSTGGIGERLADVSQALPLVVWLVLLIGGYFLGRLASRLLEKDAEKRMIVNVMTHPAIAEMLAKGWEPIAKQSRARLLFSKSRANRGLGTAGDVQTDAQPPEYTV